LAYFRFKIFGPQLLEILLQIFLTITLAHDGPISGLVHGFVLIWDPLSICSVDSTWYKGNTRTYNSVIATSTDGTTFTNVLNSVSSGTTLNSEKYTISNTKTVANTRSSIIELDIFDTSSSFPSSLTGEYN